VPRRSAWLDAGELEMVLHLPRAVLRVVGEVEAGSRSK
jgi:hypothetical protein